MLTLSLEMSHDDRAGQWVFIFRVPPPWNDTYKCCCHVKKHDVYLKFSKMYVSVWGSNAVYNVQFWRTTTRWPLYWLTVCSLCRLDSLDRWRKYLPYRKEGYPKSIGLKWPGWGFFGALLRPVERVSCRIEWLTGSIEHLILLTDILLPLWPHGCDGNGRCSMGSQWREKKSFLALCFSGCKNTAVFSFLNRLCTRFPILSSSLLPCWRSH